MRATHPQQMHVREAQSQMVSAELEFVGRRARRRPVGRFEQLDEERNRPFQNGPRGVKVGGIQVEREDEPGHEERFVRVLLALGIGEDAHAVLHAAAAVALVSADDAQLALEASPFGEVAAELQDRHADFENAHRVHVLGAPIERVGERREHRVPDPRDEHRVHNRARHVRADGAELGPPLLDEERQVDRLRRRTLLEDARGLEEERFCGAKLVRDHGRPAALGDRDDGGSRLRAALAPRGRHSPDAACARAPAGER